MKARIWAFGLLIAAAVAGAAWAQQSGSAARAARADPSVTCAIFEGTQAQHERRALLEAPEGAKRTSPHVLAVNYKDGVHSFVDKKPYREELSGFHWSYCGYIPALKAHLIGMEDEDLFTGKLLFDRDGRVLDGGQTVYPSPDGKLFLAESQVDGEALSHWVLSNLDGRRLWSGESGITKNDIILQEFEVPRWINDDEIQVTVTCGDRVGTKGHANLVRQGRAWRWKSDLRCGS